MHLFYTLARLCSISFKLGFSSMQTKNFQMYKLGFREAEEAESKLPTFVESWRKQGNSRKTSTLASLTLLKPLTVWITANLKILEMEVPEHLTCLLRNLFVDQKAKVRTRPGKTGRFKTGKGVQGNILLLCTFNLPAEYIMRNASWMNHKLESRLLGEISTLQICR